MIRDAGDSALLFELEPRIDAAVNARAIAAARAVRAARIPGVRDVVPTYRSVAVFFDPARTRLEAITRALGDDLHEAKGAVPARQVEVPVAYGGTDGPDLPDVARHAGLTEAEVVARHAGRAYRVFMLGFVPGFAYMGPVDASIAVPRRAAPRARVPAGSVAIAGRQTGIYPQETPGGWQIVGRTRVRPFDPARAPAFLVTAGDEVRFVPVPSLDATGPAPPPPEARIQQPVPGVISVLRPGLLTTVQDLGRWGYQDRGVPVAGPMDAVSHRLANLAVGNDAGAATLEATLVGPELRFEREAVIAIAGADLQATLADRSLEPLAPVRARAGDVLRFTGRVAGARAYVAVGGGFDTPPVLGSRSTHVLSAMGGVDGRPLRAGDRLAVGDGRDAPRGRVKWEGPVSRATVLLRALRGPQEDHFRPEAYEALEGRTFTVSPRSDRMGYRLAGGTVPPSGAAEMISDATVMGAVQVPPSGEPILLMADRQTTGGYPQIATVITADLPLAGQLAPGDTLRFRICTRREAMAALLAQEGALVALA